ncbi:hypothetical protein [Streptomyces sp. NPDC002845]
MIGILIPALAIVVPVLVAVWPSSSDTDAPADAASPSASASASASSSASEQDTASPSTEAPAPSASLSSPASTIQWTGQVRITDDDLYLDEKPPERVPGGSGDVDLGLVNPPRLSSSFEPDLALWPEKTMPTRRECSDLVSAQGVKRVEATVGAVICVRTMEGRTAVLTITSTSNSLNTGVTAQATVWSEISG